MSEREGETEALLDGDWVMGILALCDSDFDAGSGEDDGDDDKEGEEEEPVMGGRERSAKELG